MKLKAFPILLSLLLLLNPAYSECEQGCLVCTADNRCLLCDSLNAYFLSGSSCKSDSDGNCLFYQPDSSNGACLICYPDHFLTSNAKCAAVESKIDFCASYQADGVCSACEGGYVIKGDICEVLENKITGCEIHNTADDKLCDKCLENFMLTKDKKDCIEDPSFRFCARYTFIECQECTSETVRNSNAYLDNFRSLISSNGIDGLNESVFQLDKGAIDTVLVNECIPTPIADCTDFEDVFSCKTCATGFYLTSEKKCQKNPIQPLLNCTVYKDLNNCLKCGNGFHLSSQGQCEANEDITGCAVYDGSAKTTTCLSCDESTYLSNNSCVERNNSEIENCATLSLTADKCEVCGENQILATDGLLCLPSIAECKQHKPFSIGATETQCDLCNPGFFIKDNACQSGSTDNCAEYRVSEDVCVRCSSGFVLGEEGCEIRSAVIPFCSLFSSSVDDECETCELNSIKYTIKNTCKTVTTNNNCNVFGNFNQCLGCEDKFELIDNSCVAILPELNCLKKEGENCLDCVSGYYLDEGVCRLIPTIITENCETVSEVAENKNACLSCSTNHIPYSTSLSMCRDNNQLGITIIEDCDKYDKTGSTVTCVRCTEEKVLAEDSLSCLDACPEGQVAVLGQVSFDSPDNADSPVTPSPYKQCKTTNPGILENCNLAAMVINEPKNPLACIQCGAEAVPVQLCPVELSYFNASSPSTDDLLNTSVALECVNNTSTPFGATGDSSKNENCLYYKLESINSNPVWLCKSCKFGKTGSLREVGESGIYEVNCDTDVLGCDNSVEFGGSLIDSVWMRQLFGFTIPYKYSCHSCTSDTAIPFLNTELSGKLNGYSIGANPPTTATNKNGTMITCREPSADGLNMSEEEFSSFPENCALGFLMVNRPKKSNLTVTSSAICVACKNGFKPVKDNKGFMIIECAAIENCKEEENGGWFNGCKTCKEEGFALKFNSETKEVMYNECVETTAVNCQAYDDTNNVCVDCKKGFVFNSDNVCEALKPHNCSNFNILKRNSFSTVNNINQIELALHKLFEVGCESCSSSDFINIKIDETITTCVSSPYIEDGGFPDPSQFSTGCLSYSLNPDDPLDLFCLSCAEGTIPTIDKQKCVPVTDLPNCSIADESGVICQVCNDTHTKVGATCEQKQILNCKTFSNDVGTLTCLVCEDTFLLSDNECKAGIIPNCRTYNTNEACSSCLDGNVLINNGSACLPIPSALNCVNATIGGDGLIECTQCQSNFGFSTEATDFNVNACLDAKTVPNCVEYDIKEEISDSTFNCIKCEDEFYLTNNSCLPRDILTGCKTPVVDANKCEVCEDNYLFNEDEVCVSLRVGVGNCASYTIDAVCEKCSPDTYPSEGDCIKIKDEEKIENCINYSAVDKCSLCDPGFYINEDKCSPSNASNCKENESETNCLNCEEGWHLQTTEGATKDCIQNTVTNCATFVPDVNQCATCVNGNIINEQGSCVAVEVTIPDCDGYDNETGNCNKCAPGFILAADGKSCELFSGPNTFSNCSRLRYRATPVCVACEVGNYFFNGKCTGCIDRTYGDGCMYCDYKEQERCLICRNGYWMNKDGDCILNESLGIGFKNEIRGADVLKGFWITLLLVLMTIN